VYVITAGPEQARGRPHLAIAEAAIRGGATAIQLRMKDGPARAMLQTARTMASLCRAAGVTFIVNDRVDVALTAGADGVHVGQDDLPAAEARTLLGTAPFLGVSAATVDEAVAALRDRADYVGVGALYTTATKADAGSAVGPARVAEIAASCDLPIVGIGGITLENAADVIRAGASGIAVITAVTMADDMVQATQRLREVVDRTRAAQV
jgi:thiamine-phosphate pyrophosphorylase